MGFQDICSRSFNTSSLQFFSCGAGLCPLDGARNSIQDMAFTVACQEPLRGVYTNYRNIRTRKLIKGAKHLEAA